MLDALLDELDGDESEFGDLLVDEQSHIEPIKGVPTLTSAKSAATRNPIVVALRAGQPACELELVDAMLQDEDLSGLNLSGVDLSGAKLARSSLVGAKLDGCRMRGATLYGANLDNADFTGADLTEANLETATGKNAGFGGVVFHRARLAEAVLADAAFAEADFDGADLRGAHFPGARAIRARLVNCDATSTSFARGHLQGVSVDGSIFDHADLRGATLTGVRGYESASFIGTDTRDIPPLGVFMWKRFVTDQNYLAEFRTRGRSAEWLYRLWWLTSNCGRSMGRWALCTFTIISAFACLYAVLPVNYGDHETWLSPLYYSVVTITSLGYGDVLPASASAQAAAMLEVVLGYLMLGGLLSILSNKMARRGD